MCKLLTFLKYIFSGTFYKLRKYAIWRSYLYDYKNYLTQPFRLWSIHRKGFTIGDWDILGLTNANYKTYLNSEQYYSIHPMNGTYSKIIDDKMTIKYIFNGTDINKYMPEYYYCTDDDSGIYTLMDASQRKREKTTQSEIFNLLIEKNRLAFKPIGGSLGKGFCKVEYANGVIYVNDEIMPKEDFYVFLNSLKNYLILEYLMPHPYLAQFGSNTPNTIRYLVGRVGNEWRMIKSFIRFGTKKTGIVENFNSGGILCYINQRGHFQGGYIIKKDKKRKISVPINEHPDSNLVLEGDIPLWDEIVAATVKIENYLPQTKYLGFDFVVTNKNTVKLLEINSLTSLDSLQLDGSILDSENGKWFFSSLLSNLKI